MTMVCTIKGKEIRFEDVLGLFAFVTGCLIVTAIQSSVVWPAIKTLWGLP